MLPAKPRRGPDNLVQCGSLLCRHTCARCSVLSPPPPPLCRRHALALLALLPTSNSFFTGCTSRLRLATAARSGLAFSTLPGAQNGMLTCFPSRLFSIYAVWLWLIVLKPGLFFLHFVFVKSAFRAMVDAVTVSYFRHRLCA